MKTPLVSIGIPFYNAEATLADTVRSVFAQTYQNWELILVDDGSKDASLQIVRSIDDPRVRVISDGQNRQLSFRLNQIIDLSRGDYMARMDSDDLMHPTRIHRQVEFMESSPRTDILGTGAYTINGNNRICGIRDCKPSRITAQNIIRCVPLMHPTVMWRSTWYRTHHYRYNLEYDRAQDYDMWCRAVVEGTTQLEALPEPLLYYRELGSVTLAKMLGSHSELRQIIQEYGPRIAGKPTILGQIALSYGKSLGWCVCSALGLERLLLWQRSQLMNAARLAEGETYLNQILKTAVPGLSAGTCHVSPMWEKAA